MRSKKRDKLRKKAFDNLLPPAYGVREIDRTNRYVMALTERKLVGAAKQKANLRVLWSQNVLYAPALLRKAWIVVLNARS